MVKITLLKKHVHKLDVLIITLLNKHTLSEYISRGASAKYLWSMYLLRVVSKTSFDHLTWFSEIKVLLVVMSSVFYTKGFSVWLSCCHCAITVDHWLCCWKVINKHILDTQVYIAFALVFATERIFFLRGKEDGKKVSCRKFVWMEKQMTKLYIYIL